MLGLMRGAALLRRPMARPVRSNCNRLLSTSTSGGWQQSFGRIPIVGPVLVHPWFRTALRGARTVVLVGTIGFASYSSGVHDALADPEGQTERILKKVLMSTGGAPTLDPNAADALLVTRLGNELVVAAQEQIQGELEALVGKDGSHAETERTRLESHLRALRHQWRFVVIDDDAVQAFVTDVLPGFVFVHRGLLDLMRKSAPQLSFILGHELSHHLLEHNEQARNLQRGFSLFQLLVLATVDPTGLVSFLAIELGVLSSLLSVTLALPSSRTHESEADVLALQLVVRACRDPAEAILAHETLGAYEEGQRQRSGSMALGTSLVATHPATRQRLADLKALLPEAEAEYRRTGCALRKTQLWRALKTNLAS